MLICVLYLCPKDSVRSNNVIVWSQAFEAAKLSRALYCLHNMRLLSKKAVNYRRIPKMEIVVKSLNKPLPFLITGTDNLVEEGRTACVCGYRFLELCQMRSNVMYGFSGFMLLVEIFFFRKNYNMLKISEYFN